MSICKVLAAIILLAIIFTVTVPYIAGQQTVITDHEERTVSIIVPAVSQTEKGLVGVTSNITVTIVKPGSGKVYVSASPLTQIDMQASARTAAIVASTLLGYNPLTIDFYVSVESPSIIIGGPSAGVAMTVAMVAALGGFNVNKSIMMTGMINPDGTIGPVGGVKEKLEAAAQMGAKVFLVPLGQSVVQENVVEYKRAGPFLIRTIKQVTVDLVSYGEKMGVTVIEVPHIIDAVKYVLGVEISYAKVPKENPKLSREAEDILKNQIEYFLRQYGSIKSQIIYPIKKNTVKDVIDAAEKAYNDAKTFYDKNLLYSAASKAFQAAYLIDFACNLQKYYEKGENIIEELFSNVNASVTKVKNDVFNIKPEKLSDIEVLIAARYRVFLAINSLEKAANDYSQGKYEDTILDLTYAKWRAETARLWSQALNMGSVEAPSEKIMKHLSTIFIYEATSVIAYSGSLLQDIGVSSDIFLEEAISDLNSARKMNSLGDYYGSLGLSLAAIAKATVSIHRYFTVDVEKQVIAVENASRTSLWQSINLGAEPILALGYYEFAKQQQDLYEKLYYYELASLHAKVLTEAYSLKTPLNVSIEQTIPSIPKPKTPTSTSTNKVNLEQLLLKLGPVIASFIGGILLGYSMSRRREITV